MKVARAAVALIVVGCTPSAPTPTDADLDLGPVCDGRQNPGEDRVDGPFDRDGDGFFDAANPDCQAAWLPSQLDCDDDDPLVHPAAIELPCNGLDDDCRADTLDNPDRDGDGVGVCEDCDDTRSTVHPGAVEQCFDGIDNDCDGIADNQCGEDYNGTWAIHPPVVFGCQIFGQPLVDVDFDQMLVLWNPPWLAIGPLSAPGPLDATLDEAGAFSGSLVLGGDCVENYTFQGSFTSATTFQGVFTIDLESGAPLVNLCWPCQIQPQSFEITGVKL